MTHDLETLLDGMASPDPAVRDGWAYQELAEGIASGRFADDHETIRRRALEHLRSDQVQARTFAPLVLAWLVDAGDRDRAAFDAVAQWYAVEPDTRGYDDRLGWLHAVAHGADYLGLCARAGIATGAEVLRLLAARMTAPGGPWHDQEDARIAHAALLALTTCTAEDATAWSAPIGQALDAFEATHPDRPETWLSNTYATCATTYVALAEQPRDGEEKLHVPHADAVRAELADVLSRMTPWLLTRRAT